MSKQPAQDDDQSQPKRQHTAPVNAAWDAEKDFDPLAPIDPISIFEIATRFPTGLTPPSALQQTEWLRRSQY
jgi:hypothetical protein